MENIKVKMVPMEDPQFEDGTTHAAHITFTNPKGAPISYDAYLYLADPGNLGVPIVSSDVKTFTIAAGGSNTQDFPLVMPLLAVTQANYVACCRIMVSGVEVVTFVGAESVVVVFSPAIEWGDIVWD